MAKGFSAAPEGNQWSVARQVAHPAGITAAWRALRSQAGKKRIPEEVGVLPYLVQAPGGFDGARAQTTFLPLWWV